MIYVTIAVESEIDLTDVPGEVVSVSTVHPYGRVPKSFNIDIRGKDSDKQHNAARGGADETRNHEK